MSQPPLLAFDTSTEWMAVAVQGPAGERLALEAGGALASAALLPCIHRLLGEAGLTLRDIGAIAFGQGPGAFTGLRTSCAVAQGLGFGLGCRLLPVDSLLIVAEDARAQAAPAMADVAGFEVNVVMDARMNEAYAGRYRWSAGRWQTLAAPALYTLPALAEALSSAAPGAWFAGSALAAFGERLGLPPGARTVPGERDRAAALMRLARDLFNAGAGVDAADALPLYLRDKVAQTTLEREAVKAAKLPVQGAAPIEAAR
jgi:tRNA threonylcarbamoyladenosine biosynthesis protein TsaB